MIKKGFAFTLFFFIIYGFMSVLLLNKSRLDVISIFADKIRIRNSETVSKNGISFGSGDDDIFIDFLPEKAMTIFIDNRLELAENVICLLNGELLNAYPLKDDDSLCLTDNGKKICWTFNDNKLWQEKKVIAEFEEKGWRQAIYPLANIREFKDKIYSFIYFDDGSPRILLLDDKDSLTLTGKQGKKYKKKRFEIPLNKENSLQFRKVFQRYVSYVDPDSEELVTEKKVAKISSIRKEFDVGVKLKCFYIHLKKPVKQNILLKDISNLKSDSIVLTFGSISHYGANVIIPKFVGKISDLSIRLDVRSKLDENMIQVTDPHNSDPNEGTYLIPYGKLTVAEEDTEIDIWILKLGIPWNLIFYYLGICLLFVLLYYPSFKELIEIDTNAAVHLLLLLAAGLIFLSFRLLFSYKAFIQYPFRGDLYRDAIFGFILVPFLILEIFERSSTFAKTFFRALVLLIPCGVYLLQLSQLSSELLGAELLNEKLLGLALLMLLMHGVRWFMERLFEFFTRISLSTLTFWVPLVLIFLLRKFLIKEAVFGIRASFISDLIILGLLLGFIGNYVRNKDFSRRNSLKILLFSFLYFLTNAIFSGDRGYLIFFISMPLIFIYMGLLSSKSNKNTTGIRKVCISNGTALVVVLLIGIFFVGNVMLSVTDMERAALLTSYETRLLGFTDFSLLKERGYRITEIFAQFYETMKFYAGSGFWGRGYLNSPLGRESNWFNDNVPSAFLMSEFGLRGVMIIFIAYGIILGLIIPGYRTIYSETGIKCRLLQWRFLGLAAACFLVIPGIYMILANVGLVPFTGKNVFLFGLDSYSDLMESALLFGLIARGIRENQS